MSSAPLSLPVELTPGEGRASFQGTFTMTKSTLTVFKTNVNAPIGASSSDRAIFVGVCSLPVIQFCRNKNKITLMRANSFLFDNAALTAGGLSSNDNPTLWESLTMRFSSMDDCDITAQVLAQRHAEETHNPPFPMSRNGSTPRSVNSYTLHNAKGTPSDRRSQTKGPTPYGDEASTPRSSRLPSRRENDDIASQRSIESPRSSRLPSRRENDEVSSVTPSHSVRSSQRVAPGRSSAPPSAMNQSSRPHSARHRTPRGTEAAEREFAPAAAHPRTASSGHRRHRSSSRPSSRPTSRTHTPAEKYDATPRSARSGGHRSRHSTPRATGDMVDYSATNCTPRSTLSRHTGRSEQEMLVRNLQKLQHHRLHFMLYLHKEMVHQAYLAEEAKVKAAAPKGSMTPRRRGSSVGGRSPRHPSATAEEVARLREIEERLAKVEQLHREAERDREEAARVRREYEWKNDEMNARMAQQGIPPMNSRDMSEMNSTVLSPHRQSNGHSGQLMVVPQPGSRHGSAYPLIPHPGADVDMQQLAMYDPAALPRPDDVDLGIAIVDRYVFGEEWRRVFPAYESDIRFNAQIDVCLAMKLPRRLVTITNLVVDRPGLRVTAEIRYDRVRLERDGVERRMNGCPFRFLQRFYDMRDLYDPLHDGAKAIAARHSEKGGMRRIAGRPSSRHSSATRRRGRGGDTSSIADVDPDTRRDHYSRRTEDRVRAAEERLARQRAKMGADVHRQLRENLTQLLDEEEYQRDSIQLGEAKMRQTVNRQGRDGASGRLTSSRAGLEEDEHVERATVEVGAARQMQALLSAHRRQMALLQVVAGEKQRRDQIAAQERDARADLNDAMNPSRAHMLATQVTEAERMHREQLMSAEKKARASLRNHMHNFLQGYAAEALADVIADEAAERAVIRSEAMSSWLDLLYQAPNAQGGRGRRASSEDPATLRGLLLDLQADEATERAQIIADQNRRKILYRQEENLVRETLDRDRIEQAELADRDAILHAMFAQNRELLERRVTEREQMASLISEEQFYRKTIISDEQDAFEVIAELFASALRDLLARAPVDADSDDESPRRRRLNTPRSTKPFHYMTFAPEDMDYPPSAVLALEGMLGCSVNKNLEVVSVASPLPKVEEEDLELQAGDMILDVAGHSLHSLSHLREVLASRAMQIQEEARDEFQSVPQDQLTTFPALQKYLEVLCEHHNYLIQVLRGCEIYQIIVRS